MEFNDCTALANTVRLDCLKMVHGGKSGHIGSMLSCAEILAVLYKKILKVSAADPKMADRDRLLFSKGHGGAALFATLAELGFFPKEWLDTYYKDEGKLSGYKSVREAIDKNISPVSLTGLSHIHRAQLIAALDDDRVNLVITGSEAEAKKLCDDNRARSRSGSE